MSVLNPVRRVRRSFEDFAARHLGGTGASFEARVREHLALVRLDASVLDAYPHELSGGMRQRVTIALATICRPDFVIADEPTTALDVVVQKDVLGMIRDIQREMGSSLLLVTHDLGVHAYVTDRLAIMYAGRLVEEARTPELFASPQHPYTRHLIASLPRIGDAAPRAGLTGAPPNLAAPPSGCRFHPRCPLAGDRCRRETPAMTAYAPDHRVACFARQRRHRMMAPLLELSHVSKIFGWGGLLGRRRVPAVSDVDFRAPGRAARDIHHCRPVRQRQDHARPHDPRHGGAERRQHSAVRATMSGTSEGTRARKLFMGAVQPIFQNPFEAFNPLRAARLLPVPDGAPLRRGQRSTAGTDEHRCRAAPGRAVAAGDRRPLST